MNTSINNTKNEVGYVMSSRNYLIYIEGLPSARYNEIIVSEKTGARAMVSALDGHIVEALMLDNQQAKPGECFMLTGKKLTIPVASKLVGRVVNPLGVPLDGKADFPPGTMEIDIDEVAPGIGDREAIDTQLLTGVTAIDTLVPIAVGQRELMFGDPPSGMGEFVLDVVLNQKGKNRICIYNAIGKSEVVLKRFISDLEKYGGMEYTIIIAATSSELATLISIAPSVACAVADYFRNKGGDVLLIMDNLATHAKYQREIGLLANRIPGRESYPADMFYQHSRVLERAGKFNKNRGSGSITIIPIVETNLENFTGLIPTNVMSITDGHLLFTSQLRMQGTYPAVDVEGSVTRVGKQTQIFIHKVLGDKIRSLIANYKELEQFSKFGSELTGDTLIILKRGMIASELIRQEPLERIDNMAQIFILSLVFTTFFDTKDVEFVRRNKKNLVDIIQKEKMFAEIAANFKTVKFDELITKVKATLPLFEKACRQ
jgi:F-type H+/Na+-transporting ATPase subunit alpha